MAQVLIYLFFDYFEINPLKKEMIRFLNKKKIKKYGIIIKYMIPELMFVPKDASSISEPCSATNLHCEQPCA